MTPDEAPHPPTHPLLAPACLAIALWPLLWLLAGLPALGWPTIAISAIALACGLTTAAIASARLRRPRTEHTAEPHMARAVELLTSPDPIARLAGAQAVDRVAMAEPHMRGDAMRLWCAYLRRPAPVETGASVIAPLGGGDGGPDRVDPAEADLRRSILLLVQRRALDWPGLDVDLSGAILSGVDFSDATFDSALFVGTVFTGGADFERATFAGRTDFTGAVFADGGSLAGTRFQEDVSFHAVTLGGGVLDLTAAGFLDSLYLPVPAELTGASAARPDRVHAAGWTVRDGYFDPLEERGPAFEVE